jgi:hypothetical protein
MLLTINFFLKNYRHCGMWWKSVGGNSRREGHVHDVHFGDLDIQIWLFQLGQLVNLSGLLE